jgi:hypothetical protein
VAVKILKSLGIAITTFFVLGFVSCKWITARAVRDYPYSSMDGFSGFRGGLDSGAVGAVVAFVVAVSLIPKSGD